MAGKNEFKQGNIVSRTFVELEVPCKIYRDGEIVNDYIKLPEKSFLTRDFLQKYAHPGDIVLDFSSVYKKLQSKATCKISDFISLCKQKGLFETEYID